MRAGRGKYQGSPPHDDPSIIGLPCNDKSARVGKDTRCHRTYKSRERNTLLSYTLSEAGAAEIVAYSEAHMLSYRAKQIRDCKIFGDAHTNVLVGPR